MRSFFLFVLGILSAQSLFSQCSLCTKTAQQLGPQAASGMNFGVLYMIVIVAVIILYLVYRVKKHIL